jgi:hypothetical protein
MELKIIAGASQGKKIPPMTDYVDGSFIEEPHRQLGLR